MSPSSSVSPSPSAAIVGEETEIIAIQQTDDVTVIKVSDFNLTIQKPVDEITIVDIQDALLGVVSTLAAEVIAIQQADNITITKVPDITITIVE